MSIGNDSPSAVATRNLRHVLAQAAFFQERLPPLEASIRDLIAEVEHLRGERAGMDEWLRTMVPNDKATAAERAAVVAFVRGARIDGLADAIERGEHRREEGA